MSIYVILRNVKAVQSGPLVYGSQLVEPISSSNPNSPTGSHSFTLTVAGTGSCSATVQPVGSNDGVNFVNYGPAFTASGATVDLSAAIAGQAGIVPFNFIGGYVTAISGTNAAATLTLSA